MSSGADPKPPNIIVILTDDLGLELEECMIDKAAHCGLGGTAFMPMLKDRIVDRGLRFKNHYVVEPLCCPSRVTTLRGQYPHNTGVEGNTYPGGGFEEFFLSGKENSTIATWLHRAGYATGLFGKYLNGYGERLDPSKYSPTWVPPGWDEWHGSNGYSYYDYCLVESKTSLGMGGNVGQMNFYSSSGPTQTVPGPFYEICYNNGPVQGNRSTNHISDVLAQKAADFIEGSVNAGKPFLAYVAPYIPHLPATPAPRHENLFSSAFAPRPISFNEADVSDKPWPWNNDFNNPRLTAAEENDLDALYRLRMRSNMAVDDMIRVLTDKLQGLGVSNNTYIVFTSDNGYHLGQHRHVGFPGFVEWANGKASLFEEDVHVPFYVAGPGIPPGQTRDHVVLNTDLAPTIAELAGVPGADGYAFDGRSMTPLFGSNAPNGRTNFLLQTGDIFSKMLSYFKWGLKVRDPGQDRDWTYVEYYQNPTAPNAAPSNDTREFYNQRADPYEIQNGFDLLTPEVRNLLAARVAAFSSCAGESCQMLENAPLGQPTGIAVMVNPPTLSLPPRGTSTFQATVYGITNTGVRWSVPAGPSAGTIDAAGRYTAPNVAGTYQIVATSVADPSKSYSAIVVVRNWPLLNIAPALITLAPGQRQTFVGSATGTLPAAPRWGILENNSGGTMGGTISAAALTATYTAPAAPGVYHIGVASDFVKGYATVVVSGSARPVLKIAKSHTGNFAQNQKNATYRVTVSNMSTIMPSKGLVTVTDSLPSGLTLVSMSGSGWTCASQTCTRSDALVAAASYPAITVTVNVAANASSPQVNSVGVSGGGSTAANATDSTTIVYEPPNSGFPAWYPGVFRSGLWFADTNGSSTWEPSDLWYSFGTTADRPVAGYWNSAFRSGFRKQIGVFRNGSWFVDHSGDNAWGPGDDFYSFGMTGDIPVVGDWDGSGQDRIGIFRNGVWFLDYNGSKIWDVGDRWYVFGMNGDIPVVNKWDGLGADKIGVFRNGQWFADYNGNFTWDANDRWYSFGTSGDKPVLGDWAGSGDNRLRIGVYRQGVWFLDLNGTNFWDGGDTFSAHGLPGDVPVPNAWKLPTPGNGSARTLTKLEMDPISAPGVGGSPLPDVLADPQVGFRLRALSASMDAAVAKSSEFRDRKQKADQEMDAIANREGVRQSRERERRARQTRSPE